MHPDDIEEVFRMDKKKSSISQTQGKCQGTGRQAERQKGRKTERQKGRQSEAEKNGT